MLLLFDRNFHYGNGFWEIAEWKNLLSTYPKPDPIVFHEMDDIPVLLRKDYRQTLLLNYQGADLFVL